MESVMKEEQIRKYKSKTKMSEKWGGNGGEFRGGSTPKSDVVGVVWLSAFGFARVRWLNSDL